MQYIANHAVMENLRHTNQFFPISEFVDQFDRFSQGSFPTHWHPEMELQIILKGSAEYTRQWRNLSGIGGKCDLYRPGSRPHGESIVCSYSRI